MMKPTLIALLLASLAANVWLIKTHGPANAARAPEAPAASATLADAPVPPLSPETWALIEAGDPTSLAVLRDLGLSSTVIHALVRAELDKRYRDRENALSENPDAHKYWSHKYRMARYREGNPVKLVDLRREKNAELKRLLGPDLPPDDDEFGIRLAFLPPDKAARVSELDEDYNALYASLVGPGSEVRLPEDDEKAAFLEKQKRADLVALLTPQELAEYDLRNSATGNRLRYDLSAIEITEAEFKTLYELRKPFDEEYGADAPAAQTRTAEQNKAREEAEAALNEQIKAFLGDERYAEIQRTRDPDFKMLTRIANRLDLPREKALEAHALKTSLEKQLRDFKPSPIPGPDEDQQRTAFYATLAKEAETRFTQILGKRGWEAYRDNGQLSLRLQRPPTLPVKPR
jgi:hypothetical protein